MNHDTNPTAPDDPAGPRTYGLPIDTPLETEPAAGRVEAAEMWRIALAHVGVLGGWDRRIGAWLANWDAGTIATVASWLRRAWAEGHDAGRIEGLDEAGGLQVLACDVDRLTDHADIQLTGGEAGAQEVLEELLDSLRTRVSADVPRAEVLERVAVRSRRRYFAALAGGLEPAQRLLAMSVAVDTARTTLLADSELATAVRAIIDADRELEAATAEVDADPPTGPVRSAVLPAADADRLCDAIERIGRLQWTHRADGRQDVRLTAAAVALLRAADADADARIDEDGQLVVAGRRYEMTVGWPSRGTSPAPITADSQVDAVRGYGASEATDEARDGGAS